MTCPFVSIRSTSGSGWSPGITGLVTWITQSPSALQVWPAGHPEAGRLQGTCRSWPQPSLCCLVPVQAVQAPGVQLHPDTSTQWGVQESTVASRAPASQTTPSVTPSGAASPGAGTRPLHAQINAAHQTTVWRRGRLARPAAGVGGCRLGIGGVGFLAEQSRNMLSPRRFACIPL